MLLTKSGSNCARLLCALALSALACDGDSASSATPPPASTTTTVPTGRAEVTLEISRVEPELSPVEGKRFRFTWFITLREAAGVSARVTLLRQDIWNRDFDQMERTDITGDEIVGVCGTDQLPKGSEWQCRVPFDFNLSNFEGLIRLTVALHDEFDNPIVKQVNVPLFEPSQAIAPR
jgi:hypothetical protein